MGGGDDQLKEHLKSGALDFVLAAVPETPRLEPELHGSHCLPTNIVSSPISAIRCASATDTP